MRISTVSPAPGLATILLENTPALAIWADGFVLPLAEAARRHGAGAPPSCIRAALTDWDRWCDLLEYARNDGVGDTGWLAETAVDFLPAITDPPTIYCAATNYHDHIREMRSTKTFAAPRTPMYFLVPPASLAGHRGATARPDGCERLDWEVELAVIIGREADRIPAAQAHRVIAGYTVANDLSLRDFAHRDDTPFFPDWLAMKSYAGCTPLGPAIVPAECVPDPMNLELALSVNGERRQGSTTANMVFSIAEQIEYLSRIVPLRAGDVILTGTPAGTAAAWDGAYLSPGDTVVAEIRGVGRLETRISH
ncbi:fumarylacetoacetate hydrolase family protein [Nocardia jiangxiensis]|uniref:Fumarylacetoacetate hydrolase family protein n=1 Tax=Nocardia jiangxiensis TaxID=282685 RepID=A0ABW6SCM4_9NOCA